MRLRRRAIGLLTMLALAGGVIAGAVVAVSPDLYHDMSTTASSPDVYHDMSTTGSSPDFYHDMGGNTGPDSGPFGT